MRLLVSANMAAIVVCAIGTPSTTLAQFRGSRGSFDPAEMVRNMDANKNGQLEPSEMQSNRMSFWVRGAAERAGMDTTKPLPVDKLIEAMQRSREERSRDGDRDRDRDRDRDDRRSERNSSSPPPPMGAPGVATFGTPAAGAPTGPTFGTDPLAAKFEPRVINYVNDMLERYDRNKDNYVDSEEWKTGRWSTPPEESDLNKDNRLSKEELCIRIAKRFGSMPASTSSSSSSTSSSAESNSDQVRRYAEGLLRQYDRDNDGKLSREEWENMPPQHHSADSDRDGTITTDELAAKLASYAGGSSSTSSGSSFATSGTGTGVIRRFRTPAERLPTGLPSWFFEKDANQDGQVMMSEFASLWSEEAAAEFTKSDLNRDGIITAKECLKAESLK